MKFKLSHLFIALAALVLVLFPETLDAQCAMCKAAPSSNLEAGGTGGAGLNKGIFMLFLAPYTLVAVIGFVWWRNRKRAQDEVPTREELQHELDAVA